MRLHNLQTAMSQAILADDVTAVSEEIYADPTISVSERLGIYHQNVIGGLIDVLADTFSATRKLVGDEFFRVMAHEAVLATTPAQSNINSYGNDFPEFIQSFAPAASLPYLPDVARFEWLWNEAYLAEDDSPLIPQSLRQLPPEYYATLTLRLRHSARLFTSAYPVDSIWRFCESQVKNEAPDITAEGINLLILRPELDVVTISLNACEYKVMEALHNGESLQVAVNDGYTAQEDFDLAAFLARHMALGSFKTL